MVAGAGKSSKLIEYWGGGGWSHWANVLEDGSIWDARSDVEGGKPPGVQHRPAGYLDAQPRRALLEFGGPEHYGPWAAALESQEGKPYDKVGIKDFATGSYTDRNWRDESAWFCDEYGLWAAEQACAVPKVPVPLFRINPGAAMLYILGAGARVVQTWGCSLAA